MNEQSIINNKTSWTESAFYKIEMAITKKIESIVYYEKMRDIILKRRLERYHKNKNKKGIKNHDQYWIERRKKLMGIK